MKIMCPPGYHHKSFVAICGNSCTWAFVFWTIHIYIYKYIYVYIYIYRERERDR